MMDRVIWAYGMEQGLDFTLFRPFNWIGAGLDSINTPKEGSSRVITNFWVRSRGVNRSNWSMAAPNGVRLPTSTTGIDALMRIIANERA